MPISQKQPLLQDEQLQFGAITFFARPHGGDCCGSNGLPLTPNSIVIVGRAQRLKTIQSPFLCTYLDIIRGKHERTVVVSQYCGTPLIERLDSKKLTLPEIKKVAYQVLTGLDVLHRQKIIHRTLSNDNILLQENGDVKLFNYGLFYMSDSGALVSFPVLQVLYTAPEVFLQGVNSRTADPKADVWSLGMCLAELALGRPLWGSLKLGQRIRKVLCLLQGNTATFEKIAREHNSLEQYLALPESLREIINSCLNVFPSRRPTCAQLLEHEYFKEFREAERRSRQDLAKLDLPSFEAFSIHELYAWWKLAGGDALHELRRHGLVRSCPPALTLPLTVLREGTVLGEGRSAGTLFEGGRVLKLPLDALLRRFAHVPPASFYPLIHSKSRVVATYGVATPCDTTVDLPLVIKERDPEYQLHRVLLFRRLLHGYPFTRELIIKEAENDIPPHLRGEVWAALLGVKASYQRDYMKIDKYSHTTTDRQIEVDIPRCHQYNELLSSTEGHKKLKRILKAWVRENSQYVYWQGLDSLTAPFLYLNFNDEAKAFACLSAFIPKFLHKFFLKDNSAVIEEYLAKFLQLIAFHDPELANHLHEINFYPQLFAIPWFLTLFSHVFPLYKILPLWDRLLVRSAAFGLHVGVAVLQQVRSRLLGSGFNECILLFSDLPEVDIERCVALSTATYRATPASLTAREHDNPLANGGQISPSMDISGVKLEELRKERCPRISVKDVVDLIRNEPDKILLVDIRNPTSFARCAATGSINVPFSSVSFGENLIENVGPHSHLFRSKGDKIVVVIGDEECDLEKFPPFLVQCNISRVCVLHGGFNTLLPITPTVLTSIGSI